MTMLDSADPDRALEDRARLMQPPESPRTAGARSKPAFTVANVVLLLITLGYPEIPRYRTFPFACSRLARSRRSHRAVPFPIVKARRCLYPIAAMSAAGVLLWMLAQREPGPSDLNFLCLDLSEIRGAERTSRSCCLRQVCAEIASASYGGSSFKRSSSPRRLSIRACLSSLPHSAAAPDTTSTRRCSISEASGFGLAHVYGVIVFLGATFYYASAAVRRYAQTVFLLVLQSVGLLLSRTGIPILAAYLLVFSKRNLVLFTGLFLLLSSVHVTDGALVNTL